MDWGECKSISSRLSNKFIFVPFQKKIPFWFLLPFNDQAYEVATKEKRRDEFAIPQNLLA